MSLDYLPSRETAEQGDGQACIFSPSRDDACSRFLIDNWDISNQCQDSQEFLG
jgi:hypothetical protein